MLKTERMAKMASEKIAILSTHNGNRICSERAYS